MRPATFDKGRLWWVKLRYAPARVLNHLAISRQFLCWLLATMRSLQHLVGPFWHHTTKVWRTRRNYTPDLEHDPISLTVIACEDKLMTARKDQSASCGSFLFRLLCSEFHHRKTPNSKCRYPTWSCRQPIWREHWSTPSSKYRCPTNKLPKTNLERITRSSGWMLWVTTRSLLMS